MRTIDVDALHAEGSILYKIGGSYWLAPEPDLDTTREVVRMDIDASVATLRVLRGQAGTPPSAAQQPNEDLTDDQLMALGGDSMAGVDALVPQLQRLLFRANEEGQYVDGSGAPVGYELREPIPAGYATAHLSAKRMGTILAEVLGEGGGRA